jgi:hypothetical protein
LILGFHFLLYPCCYFSDKNKPINIKIAILTRMVKKVGYKILKQVDNVQIREYPNIILATVMDLGENEAFGILFRYISGNNKVNKKVKMTAPVINSQKIEMTAPVISSSNCMAFVLPSNYSMETAPEPLNSNVSLKQMKERKVAVIRFRGRALKDDVAKKTKELQSKLKQNNIRPEGTPFLMRYNPPFFPGFLRRNEVGIKIHE